jgi:thioredoxin-like negative regulator of GroEL
MSYTLVMYMADWCGPTASLKKRIEEKPLSLPVVEVNVDEKPLPAQKLGLRGVPALALFRTKPDNKQELRGVLMGDTPVDMIEEWIEEMSRGVDSADEPNNA